MIHFMHRLLSLLSILILSASCSSTKVRDDYVFYSKTGKARYIYSYNQTLQLYGVPVEETDVATTCGTAHVVMCGPKDGQPLVLFHGMDASSTMWFPNIKALSRSNRVYAIDFPLEAGKSVACQNKLSNNDINIFYNEIFDHFQMKDIAVMGASRGGWMATYVALHSGNKIGKIVLLSPAQTFGGLRQPGKVLTAVTLKLFPSKKRLNHFFDSFSLYPDKISHLYKEQFYLANVVGKSKPRYINMQRFSDAELRSLKIPILVLIGDHDVVNNEKAIKKAHEVIPGVETALIKNAGHFLSIDQSEIVNQKIVDFLNKK